MKNTDNKIISVVIDDKTVSASVGDTVLEAAQKAGIYIPTLCYLKNIKPYGGCRLCMVDIKGMRGHPTACTTPIQPDMVIYTKTPELQKLRREIFELLLSEHPYTCLVCKDKDECNSFMNSTRKVGITTGCNFCPRNGNCELQDLAKYLEIDEIIYPIEYKGIKPVKDNPFYDIDYNLCVLCGRCVRVCNEVRYSGVLSFVDRGNSVFVGTAFGEPHKNAGCEFCGACVDVCPSGSLSEKIGKWVGVPDKSTETSCVFCPVGCKMNINTKGHKIANVGPKPGPRTNPLQLCVRGKFVPGDIVHNPERIKYPLIKKNDKWIEVTWEKAISFAANNLERYRGNQFGVIGSAQESLENNYLLQKFSRKVMRSNNVDMLSSFPDKDIIKKIHDYYSQYKPVEIDDIETADTILVIGSKAYSSHPLIENKIRKAANDNKKIIYAHTFYTKTSDFAEQNIFYRPGEEHTFLILVLNILIKRNVGKISKEIKQNLKDFDIDTALKNCNIAQRDIETLASSLINSKKLIIIAGDEILRSKNSICNFNALYNLQLILNKEDQCRIVFLLGEGNRYGGTFVGMHPDLLPNFASVAEEENIKNWSDNWKVELSNIQGLTADEMVNNINETGITTLFIAGNVPAHPNFAKLKFLIQQNMFLTETSKYANVFFPITSFIENSGHIINIERKIKVINPAIPPINDSKPIWYAISKLAQTMLERGFEYDKTEDIFSEIKSFTDLSFQNAGKNINEELQVNPILSRENREFPVKIVIENNYFHYIGNILSSLINDIKTIREEGILNISSELAEELNIKDEDTVQVSTKYGKQMHKIKIMTDLNDKIAYFKPNWEHLSLFSNSINFNRYFISAKIEKV